MFRQVGEAAVYFVAMAERNSGAAGEATFPARRYRNFRFREGIVDEKGTALRQFKSILIAASIAIGGCASTPGPDIAQPHDGMDAVLWVQNSTEYAATTHGIYSAAAEQLEQITAASPDNVGRMAIVMDVDETVLDNSPYQGQMVLDDTSYESESWDRWISLQDASAIPGAIDFIQNSQALGAQVMFVTNRACRVRPDETGHCPQKLDTLVNLQNLGVNTQAGALFLRNDLSPVRCRHLLSESERTDGRWSSDKSSRRACIAADYDIVMLFGDQLGDFTSESSDTTARQGRNVAADYEQYWGRSWFMLPNPTYGDWQPQDAADKRAVIRAID